MPVMVPVLLPIVATAVFVLLHTPPVVPVVPKVVEVPAHKVPAPVIVPVVGSGLTVMTFVVVAVPHALVTL